MLVGFGATANHCAFYPMSSSTVAAHGKELRGYDTSKGTIRFHSDRPLPASIVRKLVKARIAENRGGDGGRERADAGHSRTLVMSTPRRFPTKTLRALSEAKILGIRAGGEHRHTGVWVVVVDGRVYVRSWSDKSTGWYRAFHKEPRGSIEVAGRNIAIRGKQVRSERLRKAVSRALAQKYDTKASQKWVRGFAEPRRAHNTLELVPARGPAPRARVGGGAGAPS